MKRINVAAPLLLFFSAPCSKFEALKNRNPGGGNEDVISDYSHGYRRGGSHLYVRHRITPAGVALSLHARSSDRKHRTMEVVYASGEPEGAAG